MKKILINIILILGSFALKAQYPLTQNLGSSSTLVQVPANGGIIGGVILRVFTDTTAANLTNLKYYDGALIKTTSPIEAIWWRDLSSMLWIQLLPSGGGTGASGWTLGGNILIPRSDSSVLGSIDNTDWYLISNNQKFLKLNRGGIQANSGSVVNLGVNMSTGDLSFGGSSSTPTWQQTLTAGSTLTGNNSVQNSGSYVFEMFNNQRSAIRFNNSTSITYLGDIDNTVYGDKLVIDASSSFSYFDNVDHDIRVGINNTSPTAYLHLAAGTAGAQTAPLKFTSGTNLASAEAGAMEWNGTNLFITQTSGPTRKTIAYTTDIPSGLTVGTTTITSGTNTRVLYDNSGVLGENAGFTFDGTNVTSGGGFIAGTSLNSTTVGSSQVLRLGSSSNIVYRTTNAGSDITPSVAFNSLGATAGNNGYFFDASTNGLIFAAANGTRQIARAAINLTNKTNTAGSETGDMSFYTQTGGAAIAERLRIDATGNMIFGGAATAPDFRLLEGSGGGTNYVGFKANATLAGNTIYTLPTAFPAGTYLLNSTSAGVMGFTDPSTFLTALTNGNLTTANGTAVDLGGTATANTILATSNNTFTIDGVGDMIFGDNAGSGNGTKMSLIDGSGLVQFQSSTLFYIKTTPTIQIDALAGTGTRTVLADASGVLSAPVSDKSVKEKVRTLNYGINEVMKLNPVSFEYIDGWKNYGEGKQLGFIAQDVQDVLPELVFMNSNGKASGKLGYRKEDLIPILTKAIQEQQKEINDLKKEVKKLKNK